MWQEKRGLGAIHKITQISLKSGMLSISTEVVKRKVPFILLKNQRYQSLKTNREYIGISLNGDTEVNLLPLKVGTQFVDTSTFIMPRRK